MVNILIKGDDPKTFEMMNWTKERFNAKWTLVKVGDPPDFCVSFDNNEDATMFKLIFGV